MRDEGGDKYESYRKKNAAHHKVLRETIREREYMEKLEEALGIDPLYKEYVRNPYFNEPLFGDQHGVTIVSSRNKGVEYRDEDGNQYR